MKLLIIRFSSIGDIVLTTPVIRCVKQQMKDVEIHFLLRKSYAPVIEHNPGIDKKYFYEDNEGEIIRWLGTHTDITKQKEIERLKDDFQYDFRKGTASLPISIPNENKLDKPIFVSVRAGVDGKIHRRLNWSFDINAQRGNTLSSHLGLKYVL